MDTHALNIQDKKQLDDADDNINAVAKLTNQGLRYIYIRAARLNPFLNNTECLQQLSLFCRHSRHCFIHILLDEPEHLMIDDSQLLALSRRLGEKIVIKKAPQQHKTADTWLINDQTTMLCLPDDDDRHGFFSDADSVNHKLLKEQFISDWQRANYCPSLHTLSSI